MKATFVRTGVFLVFAGFIIWFGRAVLIVFSECTNSYKPRGLRKVFLHYL